jgi:DNA-3-methyladenine glycosylase II
VRKGLQALHSLREPPSAAQMAALTQRWQPYRSVGAYYLWRMQTPSAAKKAAGPKGAAAAAGRKRAKLG